MPNTKSAKKRLQQNVERRQRNRAARSQLRTLVRRVLDAVAANDGAKADTEYRAIAAQLDRAGARGLIHPNRAARVKSRLQKRIKALKQGGTTSGS
jgi:small subunit ribosomal protein S20